MKDKKLKLPKEILVFDNPDKTHHEEWTEGRDELNIPSPFPCVISGKTNMGKSTIIYNLILRQQPEFERILIYHCGEGGTKEYDILGPKMNDPLDIKSGNWCFIKEVPPPDYFKENPCKTLVILEDLNYEAMNKTQKYNLDRLYGYSCTHSPHGLSVILTAQNFFSVPATIRRMSKLLILGRTLDKRNCTSIASKVGIAVPTFNKLMELLTDSHDTLWVDDTAGSPYPLRKNGYEILNVEDY
jgi:hypothetical protein